VETTLQELEAHTAEYVRRAAAGEELTVTENGKPLARLVPLATMDVTEGDVEEEAIARLRAMPWVIPGNGRKPVGSTNPIRIGPGEKTLAEIVSEMRE
jgi:prevent-host-death family protein